MGPAFLLNVALTTRLAAGILATQDPSVRVNTASAKEFAQAAVAAAEAYDLDPFEIVGVARNESLFRADDVGPDGKDCGIMQTRVTGSRYSCRRLRQDFRLGFMEGARELAAYRATCRGHADFDRCRFNRYNSGHHYARHGFHGRYWLRVMCFARAARAGEPAGGCADVQSRRAIAHAMRRQPGPRRVTAASERRHHYSG